MLHNISSRLFLEEIIKGGRLKKISPPCFFVSIDRIFGYAIILLVLKNAF